MRILQRNLGLPEELNGKLLTNHSSIEDLTDSFRKRSIISQMLMNDPGTFKMLEIVYREEEIDGDIDRYLLESTSAQALRNRLSAVISYLEQIVRKLVSEKATSPIRIANMGCGSARDTVIAAEKNREIFESISVDCIDNNAEALEIARCLTREKGVDSSFHFIQKSLTQLPYRGEIDLGLLIGILCGLKPRACVVLLRKIRKYFKQGAIIIASNVLENMIEEDLLFAHVLNDIIGWKLVYKTPEDLKQIFEAAGYKWEGFFCDKPTRFHAMGIGRVLFT